MRQDKLQKVIDQLEAKTSKDQATFGIFQNEGFKESYIQANQEGLKLFALELLKAANKKDEDFGCAKERFVALGWDEDWIDEQSHTWIEYIELIEKSQTSKKVADSGPTTVVRLSQYGCLFAIIVIAVAIIVGLWTLAKWIF